MNHLDFEQGIAELDGKLAELRRVAVENDGEVNLSGEISKLEAKRDRQLTDIYKNLTAAQKTQVARHPERPHFQSYLAGLITDFVELSGDRSFGDDQALFGGLGRFEGRTVMVIGQEKGHDTATRMQRNFGMARPEGYRKAIRLMRLAERFKIPVLSFVDTSGAYPGVGAEQRGQAEAIARAIETCLDLRVPLITTVIGEGGSGGAIAIAAANRVLMLEHAIYSVISPEGCASILWKDAAYAKEAAGALKITAQDLVKLGVIDTVIEEPFGGAQRDARLTIETLRHGLVSALESMRGMSGDALRAQRRQKFLDLGTSL